MTLVAGSLNKEGFDETLWQACEAYYAGHSRLCLQLQDSHGVNVNLLLLSRQLDSLGHCLSQAQWRQLSHDIRQWERRMLQPYRKLRKLAKVSLPPQEYQQMLDVELMMERKAQQRILHKLKQLSPEGRESNLHTYLTLFNLDAAAYPELGGR